MIRIPGKRCLKKKSKYFFIRLCKIWNINTVSINIGHKYLISYSNKNEAMNKLSLLRTGR